MELRAHLDARAAIRLVRVMPARALDGSVEAQAAHVRAAAAVAGGASTGSKRVEALYGARGPLGPTHFRSAHGCTVVAADGASYTDCTMALGSVALGYADPGVTRAVVEAARNGNVAAWSPMLEIEVAERLCDAIPSAERVRFLKTGAEATAAAVRIARTATGRSRVVGSGYFGWLDWSSDAAGVPPAVRAGFAGVPFDDVAALERAVADAGDDLAAVILEPVVERLPSDGWARRARELCDARGAVLIFDEIKTAFRLRTGGYQSVSGVVPDLTAIGKALANGFPLAALVGRADVMEAASRTWISSTLASETIALAAASAVLDRYVGQDVCASLASNGAAMRDVVGRALRASGYRGASIAGIDCMWMIRFENDEDHSRFLELAIESGVIFKRGAYNFPSLAHDEIAIDAIERAATAAFATLAREAA
jgi:glutamate-1-semialdehyde aminotransferase